MSACAGWEPLARERVDRRRLLILALVMVALGSVLGGLRQTVRGLDGGLALLMTLLGLLIGWGLAVLRLPDWAAAILGPVLGVGTVFMGVGRLDLKLIPLVGAFADLYDGILRWTSGGPWPQWQPAFTALAELWGGIVTLVTRIYAWLLVVSAGQRMFEPVAMMLVWSLVLWVVSAWAGWVVRRHNQPLVGVAPAGTVLAFVLSYAGGRPYILLVLLSATLLLLVLIAYDSRLRRWRATNTDSADLAYEVTVTAVSLTLALVVLAGIAPSISWRDVLESVRDYVQGRGSEERSEGLAESLGIKQPEGEVTVFSDMRAGGLPRRHLVGSRPELSQQVVMAISTGELPAGLPPEYVMGVPSLPRYYWRSITYDRYVRSGWYAGEVETVEYAAGTPMITPTLTAQRMVRQSVRVLRDVGGLLYAAGDLVVVDQNYTVARRSPEDVFAVGITATTYVARSVVSTATKEQLRSAGEDYPQWVRDRYLALPEGIPARVLVLARNLTATEPTPYDRARAIESYLRSFPYNLDVPLPPRGRDVVDYFLFDLREGYCDYYATAMVVLARAAGLPARLAIGYASGPYDPYRAEYIVTEASAHAWPEIYFPGYGWIEFEPTPGFPLIERAGEAPEAPDWEEAGPVDVPRPAVTWQSRLNRVGRWVLWGVLLLAGAAVVAWPLADLWCLRHLEPRAAVTALYRRLQRRGRRLAVPVRVADTPYEFAARFADRVTVLAQEGYSGRLLAPAAQEAYWLTDLYVQTNYSTRVPGVSDRAQAIRTWLRLRWRLWLGRVLQRLGL